MRTLVLLSCVTLTATACAPEMRGPRPVSYAVDVRPLFIQKCVACHYAGAPTHLDLVHPFDANEGLFRVGGWGTRARHSVMVVPGDPGTSFLMDKIDPAITLDASTEGFLMPTQVPAVTPAELADLRTWISSGAVDDAFFRSNVAPVFGNAANLGRSIGKCSYCHTATSPNPPDVVNAFSTRGLVNVNSAFGGLRVAPGAPDASSLIKKLADVVDPAFGQQMPLNYANFTSAEVDTIRRWIAEGALDN